MDNHQFVKKSNGDVIIITAIKETKKLNDNPIITVYYYENDEWFYIGDTIKVEQYTSQYCIINIRIKDIHLQKNILSCDCQFLEHINILVFLNDNINKNVLTEKFLENNAIHMLFKISDKVMVRY